jgi:lipoprotein-anchoring transpeptidase ErfK/SrfK
VPDGKKIEGGRIGHDGLRLIVGCTPIASRANNDIPSAATSEHRLLFALESSILPAVRCEVDVIRVSMVTFGAAAILIASLHAACAELVVTIDKSTQRLTVNADGFHLYTWPTSTARYGYTTPNGTYRPQRLERKWFSRKYDWSPMPYSIFFHHGYAVHGSYEISRLGRPASHGCIRLHPENAKMLFSLVKKHGMVETRIVVTGTRPPRVAAPARGSQATRQAAAFDAQPDEPAGIDYARRRWENTR